MHKYSAPVSAVPKLHNQPMQAPRCPAMSVHRSHAVFNTCKLSPFNTHYGSVGLAHGTRGLY